MAIPVIDIFAGPGGLGEGFCGLLNKKNERVFEIALSIEKDVFAHQTLELRSFFRQFPPKNAPEEYYKFLRGEITREELFNAYPEQTKRAQREAWNATLGKTPNEEIDKRISEALNGAKSWALIGGPPCQAYSLIGRARNQQVELDEKDERVYLYREYYRILAKHAPPVFIMENVKGILSSTLNGQKIFSQIIQDLTNPYEGYRHLFGDDLKKADCPKYKIYSLVKEPSKNVVGEMTNNPVDYIIHCEKYGIPQRRHRVILLGVRDDISLVPQLLTKWEKDISLSEAIGDLPKLRSGLSKAKDSKESWKQSIQDQVQALSEFGLGDNQKKVIRLMKETAKRLEPSPYGRGGLYLAVSAKPEYKSEWFTDTNIRGVCNHETRGHMDTDLLRYMYASIYGQIYQVPPKLKDFPPYLLPNHENVKASVENVAFNDRFRVQLADSPATTIASHISKDGHYYIHYDPTQCRSLTVREAARVQTFPDNYFFCGPRTSQYSQVGNAVPPLLANQIAQIIQNLF